MSNLKIFGSRIFINLKEMLVLGSFQISLLCIFVMGKIDLRKNAQSFEPGHNSWLTVTGHGPSFWPLFLFFSEFVGKNMLKMGKNTGPVTGHGGP